MTLGVDSPVSCLDAATGRTLKTFEGTEHACEILHQAPFLFVLSGSSQDSPAKNPLSRQTPRSIIKIDDSTGKIIWKRDFRHVDQLSLTLGGENVFFTDVHENHIRAIDSESGEDVWQSEIRISEKAKKTELRKVFAAGTVVFQDSMVLA